MAITINGSSTTIGGLAVGGLPDGTVDNGTMADNAINSAEIAAGAVDLAHLSSTGTAGSGNYLRGDNAWTAITTGKVLKMQWNISAGQSGAIVVTEDGTGSRTLGYGGYWKFPGGTAPTLTTTASKVDVICYYCETTTRIAAKVLLNTGG